MKLNYLNLFGIIITYPSRGHKKKKTKPYLSLWRMNYFLGLQSSPNLDFSRTTDNGSIYIPTYDK